MISIIYNCVQASRVSWQPNCFIAGRLHLTGTRVYARRGPGRVLADLWVSVRGEVSLKRSTNEKNRMDICSRLGYGLGASYGGQLDVDVYRGHQRRSRLRNSVRIFDRRRGV